MKKAAVAAALLGYGRGRPVRRKRVVRRRVRRVL
jgi:hypothetical protein